MNEYTEDQLKLIKEIACKDSTKAEFDHFIYMCTKTRLDPLARQIYSIKRGGRMTIQSSIDGLRLIAERSGCYSPGKEPSFAYKEAGKLLSATAYVKKKGSDNTWHEIGAIAFWDEYNAGGPSWGKMPHLMLAKCAEALALRKAFPADMSGVYSDDEMEQADKKKELMDQSAIEFVLKMIGDDETLYQKFAEITGFSNLEPNTIPCDVGRDAIKEIAEIKKKKVKK